MEVTAEEREKLEAHDAAWVEPKLLMDRLPKRPYFLGYNSQYLPSWWYYRGNNPYYNPATGYFELNGLTDLTEQDMLSILWFGTANVSYCGYYGNDNIRTNMLAGVGGWVTNMELYAPFNGANLETAIIPGEGNYGLWSFCFNKCHTICFINALNGFKNLKKDFGGLMYARGLKELYGLNLWDANTGINLKSADELSYGSLYRLIAQSKTVTTGEVVVHADVYAKLTGDYDNTAAAALTEDERTQWLALVESAAEKNITFSKE